MDTTLTLLEELKAHKAGINFATTLEKNQALEAMSQALLDQEALILAANEQDLEAAKDHLSAAMMDRLRLDSQRLGLMAQGLRDLIGLEDPVGKLLETRVRPNGIKIEKVTVPFGLMGMIYESRPNVTSDVVGLAIKAGSAVCLRTGSDAYQSARAIVAALKMGLERAGLDPKVIGLVSDTSRQSAHTMMKAKGYLDLLVPRGGKGLIQSVVTQATVPVIETGTGVCHLYVDKEADQDMALSIIENAKLSRPSVCNAAEVLLVHQDIASEFLPKLSKYLGDRVTWMAEPRAKALMDQALEAGPEDFDKEFLDDIMALAVVDSLDQALTHISQHSTGHSDAILTMDPVAADRFCRQVDSAAVYVNASTRFTDGGQFGFGCELGISTQKLHARGPMGLEQMVTYKYLIHGQGQIRP